MASRCPRSCPWLPAWDRAIRVSQPLLAALAGPAAERLASLARFRDGLARANPSSALTGAVAARLLLPGGDAPPDPALAPYAEYSITLTYGAGAGPLYFTLFRFAADGSVTQLYPPPGAAESLAPGAQWPPPGAEDYFRFPATLPSRRWASCVTG